MNKDKRNNIKLLGTLNNADESGIIANANQVYDANEDKSTQDVSKEHKERIETLETKESSMQTTLENITKTGEASAASNVTYNHNDSKLDATNVQQAVDEVHKRSNYNDGDNIIDFNTIHIITDNPEYICVAVDADKKILYGIKTDGQPYFGVGCPQQVKDYIDKQINKILGTDDVSSTIDSLKEIESFLKDFTNSDTLKALLDTKANKTDVDNTIVNINADIANKYEQINADVADKYKKSNPNDDDGNVIDTNSIYSFDNTEYLSVVLDGIKKIIEAIGLDGARKFFAGIDIQDTKFHCVVNNSEFIIVWLDSENRVIFGIKNDGEPYFGVGIPSQIQNAIYFGDNTYPTTINKIDNTPEYISVYTDALNKILEVTTIDGIKKFYTPVEVLGILKTTKDENQEYLQATIDNDNKILSGYRKDGVFIVGGISTNHVELGNKGINDLKEQLEKEGFAGINDQSNSDSVVIPKPNTITIVNISHDKNYIEVYTKSGFYFKKAITEFGLQGQTSKALPKKNYQFDCDGWTLKVGDWVPMDTFQLKAWYIDVFRGRANIAYNLFRDIISDRDFIKQRPYLNQSDYDVTTSNNPFMEHDFDGEIRLVPDGIPILLYFDGSFMGLYTLNIKKRRGNYGMKKKNVNQILLDPNWDNGFFASKANLDDPTTDSTNTGWNVLEIRNPKLNRLSDGEELDFDTASKPMDYCPANDKNGTKVKAAIRRLGDAYKVITAETTDDAKRAKYEEYFDVDWNIDYLLHTIFIGDFDGITRNTLYATWQGTSDNAKWYPLPYDCDQIFGINYIGEPHDSNARVNAIQCVTYTKDNVIALLTTLYKDRLDARYKHLVDSGVLTVNHVMNMLEHYIREIGIDNYKMEYDRWSNTPSYRDGTQTYTDYPTTGGIYDGIGRTYTWLTQHKAVIDKYFNYK